MDRSMKRVKLLEETHIRSLRMCGKQQNLNSGGQTQDLFLLEAVKEGDQHAMARLYDTHSQLVYSVALSILRDPTAAEDVLQDVFLSVWCKPSSFVATQGNLAGWLAIVSRNRSIDVIRARRASEPIDQIPLMCGADISSDAEREPTLERFMGLMAKLAIAQQKVLDYAFSREWTHSEIAAYPRVPLGPIKSRIRTALLALQKAYQKGRPKLPLVR